jgi:hypothetical protein
MDIGNAPEHFSVTEAGPEEELDLSLDTAQQQLVLDDGDRQAAACNAQSNATRMHLTPKTPQQSN